MTSFSTIRIRSSFSRDEMLSPIDSFFKYSFQKGDDVLQELTAFLENNSKRVSIVERGYRFVKPQKYFDLGTSIKTERKAVCLLLYL
jgi:hypothetical protein